MAFSESAANIWASMRGFASAQMSHVWAAFKSSPVPFIILLVLVGLIAAIVVVTTTWRKGFRPSSMQSKPILSHAVRLDTMTSPMSQPAAELPTLQNGRQFSYSYWVYLEDMTGDNSNNRLVFYRGQKNELTQANPLVMMDGATNRMHIVLKTVGSTLAPSADNQIDYRADLRKVLDNNLWLNRAKRPQPPSFKASEANRHVVLTVDYVPLQRWVNVIVAVNDQLATLYVDGETYLVQDVNQLKGDDVAAANVVLDDTQGDVYIGRNDVIAQGRAMSGTLSNATFFNYAVPPAEAKDVYREGPVQGSWGDVGDYGVRFPIYKKT